MAGCISIGQWWFRVVLAVSIACVLSIAAPNAVSQLTIPPVPPVPGVPLVPQESHDPGTMSVQPPELWPAPGYWIVSTEASPQSFDSTPPVFCPRVTRFDDCVGYRRSSLPELSQSIIPGLPVCIVVHGSFMDAPSVYPESRENWKWLKNARPDRPFQMIYFSWPSDESLTALIGVDVLILGSRASRNGHYLASLIQQLPPDCPVSLVGHSYGTRVIAAAMHLIGGGVVEGYRHPSAGAECSRRRFRCVFTASAIDHDWLNPGEEFDRALCCTECLLNLKNSKDPVLCLYPFRRIGSSRALGKTGFTPKDRVRLQGWSAKVVDLDVSHDIGCRHVVAEYANRPWLATKISNYVFFPDVN